MAAVLRHKVWSDAGFNRGDLGLKQDARSFDNSAEDLKFILVLPFKFFH